MSKDTRYVGLDVHAATIAVAIAEGRGEVRSLGEIPNRPEAVQKLLKKLGDPARLQAWSSVRSDCAFARSGQERRPGEDRPARRREAGAGIARWRPQGGLRARRRARGAARPGSRARSGGDRRVACASPREQVLAALRQVPSPKPYNSSRAFISWPRRSRNSWGSLRTPC
jgi:hypothetical protein